MVLAFARRDGRFSHFTADCPYPYCALIVCRPVCVKRTRHRWRLFWQRLRWVEIPMALPVIFRGIRTAVVMNIGVMAIAA